jgi:hypothetical protein
MAHLSYVNLCKIEKEHKDLYTLPWKGLKDMLFREMKVMSVGKCRENKAGRRHWGFPQMRGKRTLKKFCLP